jgi:hypothetical protein
MSSVFLSTLHLKDSFILLYRMMIAGAFLLLYNPVYVNAYITKHIIHGYL